MGMSFLTDEEFAVFIDIVDSEQGWILPETGQSPDQILWENWRAIADTQDWELFKIGVLDSHASMAQSVGPMLTPDSKGHLMQTFIDAWVIYLTAKLAPHTDKTHLPQALANGHKSPEVVAAAQKYIDKLAERGGDPTWEDAQASATALGLAWQNLHIPPAT